MCNKIFIKKRYIYVYIHNIHTKKCTYLNFLLKDNFQIKCNEVKIYNMRQDNNRV